MASLLKLKQELQFNHRLGRLLDALKSIAAQQFQLLERRFRTHQPFFDAVQQIAGTFDVEHCAHPFTQASGPVGVIVVTSDTGLLGGLNQQVVAAAVQEYRRSPGQLLVVGERGAAYLREAGLPCRFFAGALDADRRSLSVQLRDYALNQVLSGRLGALSVAYPRAISFTVQRVELLRALPCGEWFRATPVSRGVRGSLILESSVSEVLESLVFVWLGQTLYDVLGMGRLAELAARSIHLEGSSQELERRGKKLLGRYFRERREAIDRNIRELFAAKSLYSGS